VDAVRSRIRRGSLDSDKGEDGRVFVWLVTDEADDKPESEIEGSRVLVEELRDRIEFLQRELERKDAILLNMTEAMKAIGPPAQEEPLSEAPGAPETATEQPGRVEPQPAVEGTQEAAEPRSWWRRVFRG
jgi:hypothetical protein